MVLGKLKIRARDLLLRQDRKRVLADQKVRAVLLELLFRPFKHGFTVFVAVAPAAKAIR